MRLPHPNTKASRVLSALMTGESYNLFEAELQLHDRSLHSTVSILQNTFGIQVSRQYEMVPGYQGKPVRCRRYWIDFDERMRITSEIRADKEKAPNTSDQTKEKGFDTSERDDKADDKYVQASLLHITMKYAKNGLKALTRF